MGGREQRDGLKRAARCGGRPDRGNPLAASHLPLPPQPSPARLASRRPATLPPPALAPMASFFTFAQPIDIDIRLSHDAHLPPRKFVDLPSAASAPSTSGGAAGKAVVPSSASAAVEQAPVYFDGESVSGQATIRVRDGKKVVHEGIKVEFVSRPLLVLLTPCARASRLRRCAFPRSLARRSLHPFIPEADPSLPCSSPTSRSARSVPPPPSSARAIPSRPAAELRADRATVCPPPVRPSRALLPSLPPAGAHTTQRCQSLPSRTALRSPGWLAVRMGASSPAGLAQQAGARDREPARPPTS